MRITKIEITHFGKWENFTLEFQEGTQVIFGKNESGKSTICAFLQAMFYGLPNEKKGAGASIREDLRKRYAPWDGSLMEGTVYFIADGRSYVLSRRLGKTRKGDKVSLKDGKTWEEITDIPTEEIGHTFFGVGEEAFLKTLFISQFGAAIRSSDEDEILKRLSNLKQSGSEDISYQSAAAAIEKAKYELLSKSEKAGLIPKTEQEKEALEFEYKEAVRLSEQYRTDMLCQNELARLSEQLQNEAEELSAQKELAKEHARFLNEQKSDDERKTLLERREQHTRKIEEKQEKIKTLEEELSAPQMCSEISGQEMFAFLHMEQELDVWQKEFDEDANTAVRIEQLAEEMKEHQGKQRNLLCVLSVLMGILSVIGMVFSFCFLPAAAILFIVSLICSVFSFLASRKKHKKKTREIEQEKNELIAKRKAFEEKYKDKDFAEKKKKLSSYLALAGVSHVSELSALLEKRTGLVQEKQTTERELTILLEAAEQTEEDLRRLPKKSEENFSAEALSYCGKSVEEIDRLLAENHEKQLENQRREEAVRYSVEHAFSGTRSVDVILTELTQKEETLCEYRFYYDALLLAEEALSKSYAELKEDFAPLLNERVGEILSALTDGKYSELKISDEYKVMLKDSSFALPVSAEHLSNGTYDILYLALRLGVAEVIFPEKIPFLMLDDSFLQLDDERAARAADYIMKNAKIEQVFYFTCHSSQAALFGEQTSRIEL